MSRNQIRAPPVPAQSKSSHSQLSLRGAIDAASSRSWPAVLRQINGTITAACITECLIPESSYDAVAFVQSVDPQIIQFAQSARKCVLFVSGKSHSSGSDITSGEIPDRQKADSHVDKAIPEKIRDLADLWDEKRQGRGAPAWSAIDAFDLRPWLGDLEIIDVIREPFLRFRFRLVGTNITKIDGTDLTGTYAEDFFTGDLAGILDEYQQVVETCEPLLYWRFERDNARGLKTLYDKAVFPLAEDGWTVDRLMIYVSESDGE